MSNQHYLSKAIIDNKGSLKAILRSFRGTTKSESIVANHKLIWTLFPGPGDVKRDFLWKEGKRGTFYVLSNRKPDINNNGVFKKPLEIKSFNPKINEGDSLSFMLRCNPVKTVTCNNTKKKVDVVMNELYQRKEKDGIVKASKERTGIIIQETTNWLRTREKKWGVDFLELHISNYNTLKLEKFNRGNRPIQFSVVDVTGSLKVESPDLFLKNIFSGFGRSKSYGCGLMLIKKLPTQ